MPLMLSMMSIRTIPSDLADKYSTKDTSVYKLNDEQ